MPGLTVSEVMSRLNGRVERLLREGYEGDPWVKRESEDLCAIHRQFQFLNPCQIEKKKKPKADMNLQLTSTLQSSQKIQLNKVLTPVTALMSPYCK